MENRDVVSLFIAIFVLLLIIVSFMAVILHSMSYYSVPVYSSEKPDLYSDSVIVFSPAYIAKRDTNMFLEIVALLVLSTSIFGAGLLNYLKKPESSK